MEWHPSLHRTRLREWWDPHRRAGLAGIARRWGASCIEFLFPSVCLLCGEPSAAGSPRICAACEQALTDDGAARCPRCAKPLPQHSQADGSGCPLCREKRWRLDHAVAVGTYGGRVRDLILRIKRVEHEPLCLAAGELLAARIRLLALPAPPDVIVPVPMHWLRKWMRGSNDAEVLAEAVARALQMPLDLQALRCLRVTQKQGTLSPEERRRNVRGAYAVRRRGDWTGAHVLVIDDVMTTGATANEIARVFRRAGAARVSLAVVARGVGFD